MGVCVEPAHRAPQPGGSIPRRALAQLQKLPPPSLVAHRAALRHRLARSHHAVVLDNRRRRAP
eukprot:1915673-Prymnesium_polylepis.1